MITHKGIRVKHQDESQITAEFSVFVLTIEIKRRLNCGTLSIEIYSCIS